MERLQKERESNRRPVADVLTKAASANTNSSAEGFRVKPRSGTDSSYDPMALVKTRVAPSGPDSTEKKAGVSRRRYYSSSDDEDDDDESQLSTAKTATSVTGTSGEKFLTKLESFDSDFWQDSEAKDKRKLSDFGPRKPATTFQVIFVRVSFDFKKIP